MSDEVSVRLSRSNITLTTEQEINGTIQITDGSGRLIFQEKVEANKGETNFRNIKTVKGLTL